MLEKWMKICTRQRRKIKLFEYKTAEQGCMSESAGKTEYKYSIGYVDKRVLNLKLISINFAVKMGIIY